ncbi:hypothetical protein ACQEVI_12495 [Promicromonospora sp. CA-289599]|uniref:hypothetical protein n=1 Tax=Promicromonospora sp. CA-289599 TaxID=3240014 RepID=UPI003D8F3879
MPAIDPELIPGANLDPDAVDDAARSLRADALAVRDAGVDVVGAWYGLRADYQAPEADQLLSALDPVRSDTARLGDDLEQVATALGRFAQDLRAIKSAFDVVRADAWTFHARISTNPEWEFDPELVAQNTTLLGRVNSVQVQLWDAERECANAIRAIDCLAPWNAGVSDGPADPNTFGLTEIPTETAMPWGAPVEQKEHCPASAVTSVRSAVWDGFAKDVIGEGFLGLGGLIGLDEHGFSAETFTATWGGMGALIGRDPASGQWSWGTAGDAWLETGKSLVAWDMWEEDPARAFGTAAGNILLTVATLGTGAAIKGVATAGRTGQVLSATMQGARILGNAMDPIAVLRGGTSLVSTTRATGVTAGLSAGLRSLSQIEVPAVTQLSNVPEPAAMKGNDIPARMETPSVEKYTTDNGHLSSVNHVREPVTVGAAQGAYGSEGSFGTGGDTVIDGGNGQPYGGLPDGDVSGGHMPDGDVPDGDAPGGDRPDEGADWDDGDRDADDPDPAGQGGEPATESPDHGESGSGSDGGDRSGLGDDPIAWENPDEGVSLTESQKTAADEYLATSRQIEPRITQDMQDLAAEHPGARLEGLDYRLKSEDSFYRKLATAIGTNPLLSADDQLARMKDSVRFTFLVEPGDYVRSTQAIIDDLSERGYEPFGKLKNTWDQPGYQGINSNWVDQSGRIIEVQFHTPDSFDAKMAAHSLYEEQRVPGVAPERRAQLEILQDEIFDAVPRPEDADAIDWPDPENGSTSHATIDDPGQAADGAQAPAVGAESIGGGHTGPRDIALREIWSEDAYDEIRDATDDVTMIAAATSNLDLPDGTIITLDDLAAIKEHVFLTEHELRYGDGTVAIKRFDAIPEQAEAWFRLQDGKALPSDRLWLLHEKTELEYLRDNPGSTYREAHAAANHVANWAREVGLS